MQIFDRAFLITYALEAIAVIIGLTGVSFAASSTALARRAEFGMLRHIGMRRSQVIGMLASEGVVTSLLGVLYGLILGAALSLVLVFVVNRQSFNWSIDLAVPVWQLCVLSIALVAAAAFTAIWSGRAAMSQDAVRAVREGLVSLRRQFLAGALAAGLWVFVLSLAAAAAEVAPYAAVTPDRPIVFPADYGSHPQFRTEWWYITGWLTTAGR